MQGLEKGESLKINVPVPSVADWPCRREHIHRGPAEAAAGTVEMGN